MSWDLTSSCIPSCIHGYEDFKFSNSDGTGLFGEIQLSINNVSHDLEEVTTLVEDESILSPSLSVATNLSESMLSLDMVYLSAIIEEDAPDILEELAESSE